MSPQELSTKYIDGKYIKPMVWADCLKTKEDLYLLLKLWLKFSDAETIGKIQKGKSIGLQPLIRIELGDKRYQLNYDTKRIGVEQFIKNKTNKWVVSETGRISNDINGEHIPNLQMYLVN